MGLPTFPFQEIEEKQRMAWAKPPAPPESPDPATKQYVLPLSSPENGAESFSELRRLVVADVHARLQRLQGVEVLFPPIENSLSTEVEARARPPARPPGELLRQEREALRGVLRDLAIRLDVDAEVDIGAPRFYRWAQWLFLELKKRGLAFRRSPPPEEKSAEGFRERGHRVRPGRWFVDLSSFGERLLNDLDRTNWPAQEKKDQRYRIGRRRGCELVFQVSHSFRLEYDELPVFTTAVEALYGATFILIDPRHPILPAVLDPSYEEDVARYRERLAKGSEPRISGVRTGGFALNPANLKRLPVLVSALAMDQFSGAVMGVPAHDPELFELAQRLYLPIREAIRGPGSRYDVKGLLKEAYAGDGTLTNSSIFSGLPVRVARERMIAYLARRGICRRMTRFRLQEVLISSAGNRGVPVPVIHCPHCGEVAVPEELLPLMLPPGAGTEPSGKSGGAAAEPRKTEKLLPATCPLCMGEAFRDPQLLSPWLGEAMAIFSAAAALQSSAVEFQEKAVEASGPASAAAAASGPPLAEGAIAEGPSPAGGQAAGGPQGEKTPPPPASGAGTAEGIDGQHDPFDEDPLEAGPASDPENDGAISDEDVLPEDRDVFMPARPQPSSRRDGEDGVEKFRPAGAGTRFESRPQPAGAEGTEAGEEEEEEEEIEAEDGEEPKPPAPPESRFHPFRNESVGRWLPVDAAFARDDQGVISLLFLRAMTKFLNEIGEVTFPEPFYRYLRVGPVGPPAPKEQKPAGGVPREGPGPAFKADPSKAAPPRYTPRDAIHGQGADAVRIALLGLAPPSRRCVVDEHAVWAARHFLDRIWRQVNLRLERGKFVSRSVLESKHRLIHNTTQRLRRFKFHTALASVHEFLNFLEHPSTKLEEMDRSALRTFLVVLWPFAPHMATELWSRIGETGSIESEKWPEANKELLRAPEKEIPVRLEGRMVSRLKVPAGLEGEKLEALALKDDKVQAAIAGRAVGRVIAVVDRTVNIIFPREPKEKAAAGPPEEGGRGERVPPPANRISAPGPLTRPPAEEASSPSAAGPPLPPRI